MNADLILGIVMLVLGSGIAIWMFAARGGGVPIFIGLCLAFMGAVSIAAHLMPDGSAKTGMLAFFSVVALATLVMTLRKTRQAGGAKEP